MHQLASILATASTRIEDRYFRVPIAGRSHVFRERVYCYELYHQMRCLWPTREEYVLNGELDKAAHPKLSSMGVGSLKPDLLVHRPGHMQGNYAIVEIKSSNVPNNSGITKDLKTLRLFRKTAGYERAIYLFFGEKARAAAQRALDIALRDGNSPAIEFWIHAEAGTAAEHVHTHGAD